MDPTDDKANLAAKRAGSEGPFGRGLIHYPKRFGSSSTRPRLIPTALTNGYIDCFNQTWLRYVGLRLEKIQGWNWTCEIHPDDVEGIGFDLI
jgi:hypothetical protein